MNKYCIITPTYIEHFKYIKEYLKSFDKYVIDKEKVSLIFTVNKDEIPALKDLIAPYKNKIDIICVNFDDILLEHNVFLSPTNLLKKYGRYSFQTLKKFYTMLTIDAEKFLVLDSETIWNKPTKMEELFKEYFVNPTIWGSQIDDRMDSFTSHIQENIDYILDFKSNIWFIENFMWYYEKHILENLFLEYGSPIDIVDRVYKNKYNEGVFEILLYTNYIYKNLNRYRYSFVDTISLSKSILSPYIWENYYFKLTDFYGGACGVLERTMSLIDDNNTEDFAELFNILKFNIIRSDGRYNTKAQIRFIELVQPNILAASQDNPFAHSRRSLCEFVFNSLRRRKKKILSFWRKVSPSYKVALDNRNILWYNELVMRRFIEKVERYMESNNSKK